MALRASRRAACSWEAEEGLAVMSVSFLVGCLIGRKQCFYWGAPRSSGRRVPSATRLHVGGIAAKSPAPDRRLLAGRAGLWGVAGPRIKNTTGRRGF